MTDEDSSHPIDGFLGKSRALFNHLGQQRLVHFDHWVEAVRNDTGGTVAFMGIEAAAYRRDYNRQITIAVPPRDRELQRTWHTVRPGDYVIFTEAGPCAATAQLIEELGVEDAIMPPSTTGRTP